MSGRIGIADKGGLGPSPAARDGAPAAAEEAVDLAALLRLEGARVEGEPDLIVELIDLYAEDAPRRLASIRGALAAKDLTALRRAAHGLKGSSASLGARKVEALCEKLERSPGRELLLGGETLLSCLERELVRARRAFADERGRRLHGV